LIDDDEALLNAMGKKHRCFYSTYIKQSKSQTSSSDASDKNPEVAKVGIYQASLGLARTSEKSFFSSKNLFLGSSPIRKKAKNQQKHIYFNKSKKSKQGEIS
jgi:hypothetical protein